MTQAQVANAAGILLRQYQRYEQGQREPSLSNARAIAEALDLPCPNWPVKPTRALPT